MVHSDPPENWDTSKYASFVGPRQCPTLPNAIGATLDSCQLL